jgi:hypothetical protein
LASSLRFGAAQSWLRAANRFHRRRVVALFEGDAADAFGFQLRTDSNQQAPQGRLDLLRDAFNNARIANINTPPGEHNGIIVRV